MKWILAVLILGVLAFGEEPCAPPRAATVAQQKMCAEQARKTFREYRRPDNSTYLDYTSHFDPRANVCYIMVHTAETYYNGPVVSDVVYDAFEGRMYANYMWLSEKDKKGWEVAPSECSVKPRGRAEITCKSSEDFESLIDLYFGIGR